MESYGGMKLERLSLLQQRVLVAQVLSAVGLVKGDNVHRVGVPALLRRLGGNAEAQRHVGHIVDDYALVLRRVFRDPPQTAFQDVMTIKELLLGAGLEPNLEFGVRSEEIGGCDVKPKFASFCHFAETCAEGKQQLPIYRSRELHHI